MYLGREKGILGKFVAVLGIIQSIAWIVMCIICIVFYYRPPNVPSSSLNATTYSQYLSTVITHYFLSQTGDSDDGRTIRIVDFHAFMWIYLIGSGIWIAASIDEYNAIRQNKARQGRVTLLLGILILMISAVDLVFVSLLARDLGQCSFDADRPSDCHIARGIVMTLAARGFVMWFINVVLGVAMIISASEVWMSTMPKILSYDNHTIPRAHIEKSDPPTNGLEKENPFFRGGINPALNLNRPGVPNRSSTPVALTGRNNTNMYF